MKTLAAAIATLAWFAISLLTLGFTAFCVTRLGLGPIIVSLSGNHGVHTGDLVTIIIGLGMVTLYTIAYRNVLQQLH